MFVSASCFALSGVAAEGGGGRRKKVNSITENVRMLQAYRHS